MITSKAAMSSANAGKYFDDHLTAGDYHDQKGATPGQWAGSLAAELGLAGQVERADFMAMVAGDHPGTGECLTARRNTTRIGKDGEPVANRRAFYDVVLSPPKSVSIAALVGGDERIQAAHKVALAAAVAELEKFSAARVRKKGDADSGGDRITGNFAAAVFDHDTSRAAGAGLTPDPHLHAHIVIMNATRDEESGEILALQNFEMLRAQKWVEAVYEHRLCQELQAVGYSTRETGPKSWELNGVSNAEIAHFSKRHEAIQAKTAELKAAGATRNEKELAEAVAHDGRIRKQPDATADALREDWKNQLAEIRAGNPDSQAVAAVRAERMLVGEAMDWTVENCFERAAVVRDLDIRVAALRRLRGQDGVAPDDVDQAMKEAVHTGRFLTTEDGRQVMTREVLFVEDSVVSLAQNGRGKHERLAKELVGNRAGTLSEEQRAAAETLIGSTDFVTVFRGAAGTGKSYTLQTLQDTVRAEGSDILVLAPQNKQVLALRADEFDAKTVASFLAAAEKGEEGGGEDSGKLIIVDESGQIGGKDMKKLLEVAQASGCRVILAGDTRQHGAVAASDALVAIERDSGVTVARLAGTVRTIQRQKVDWYKQAVAFADAERVGKSYEVLNKQGCIRQSDNALEKTAEAGFAAIEQGKSCLVISQTNAAVNALNTSIRAKMVEAGRVQDSVEHTVFSAVDAAPAAKLRAGTYGGGAVLYAFRKGDKWAGGDVLTFDRETKNGIVAKNSEGEEIRISARNLEKFQVVAERTIEVGEGDKLLLTGNISLENAKLANGQLFDVLKISETSFFLRDDKGTVHELDRAGLTHFRHGYAVTSYASQGQTVDKVVGYDAGSIGASNKREWLVTISRGRYEIEIWTKDKDDFRKRVKAKGERNLARDVKSGKIDADAKIRRDKKRNELRKAAGKAPETEFTKPDKSRVARGVSDNPEETPLRLQPARPAEKPTAGKKEENMNEHMQSIEKTTNSYRNEALDYIQRHPDADRLRGESAYRSEYLKPIGNQWLNEKLNDPAFIYALKEHPGLVSDIPKAIGGKGEEICRAMQENDSRATSATRQALESAVEKVKAENVQEIEAAIEQERGKADEWEVQPDAFDGGPEQLSVYHEQHLEPLGDDFTNSKLDDMAFHFAIERNPDLLLKLPAAAVNGEGVCEALHRHALEDSPESEKKLQAASAGEPGTWFDKDDRLSPSELAALARAAQEPEEQKTATAPPTFAEQVAELRTRKGPAPENSTSDRMREAAQKSQPTPQKDHAKTL